MRSHASTYGGGNGKILYKENSLRLDDKEVEQLINITDPALDGFARYSVVLTRSNLGDKTLAQDELSSGFGGNGNTKGHPSKLETIAREVDITSGKNETDDRDKGDSRSTYLHFSVRPRYNINPEVSLYTHEGCSKKRVRGRRSDSA
jgi:hypothetical protein